MNFFLPGGWPNHEACEFALWIGVVDFNIRDVRHGWPAPEEGQQPVEVSLGTFGPHLYLIFTFIAHPAGESERLGVVVNESPEAHSLDPALDDGVKTGDCFRWHGFLLLKARPASSSGESAGQK